MVEQKPVGRIEVLGRASKNLNNIRFLRLLFLFKLEQFTFYGASAALDLPLRQWRNGSSSKKNGHVQRLLLQLLL
jgi:hypothetical protein